LGAILSAKRPNTLSFPVSVFFDNVSPVDDVL
jgi:hypothetical protein